MNDHINYQNNPLHGVSLKAMLTALVEHYGFEILFAYLNINCFRTNPSIPSSVKFLKKTDWAREKVEDFYLYEFKRLPKASHAQFKLPPRERIIPDEQQPGEPAELSLEDAAQRQKVRVRKAAEYERERQSSKPARQRPTGHHKPERQPTRSKASAPAEGAPQSGFNPWTQSKKR